MVHFIRRQMNRRLKVVQACVARHEVCARDINLGGEGRCFSEVQIAHRLAEVALGRGLDAVGAGAEIDPVEVKLENLGLAELALEPKRKHEFLTLAPYRALLRQE